MNNEAQTQAIETLNEVMNKVNNGEYLTSTEEYIAEIALQVENNEVTVQRAVTFINRMTQ